jgi:hypothetical protein
MQRNKAIWVAVLWRSILAAAAAVGLGLMESRLELPWWVTALTDFLAIFMVLFILFYPLTSRERREVGEDG